MLNQENIQSLVDELYRAEAQRVLATLIRLLKGNFDLAEEALHDAFTAALTQWAVDGVPANPRAWLVSTGRFKAIDRLRKKTRFDASCEELATQLENRSATIAEEDSKFIEDDSLRLIFTCCHPSLSTESQIALTLREVCGLTTEAIAAAFLIPPPTLAQRIVRTKSKIRDAGIPYEVPNQDSMPERLDSVLKTIYLVFNEGYSASSGNSITKTDLSSEAIRLGKLLFSLLPEAEVAGLLALMLLHDSRRAARISPAGDLILLQDQNRAIWNQDAIKEGGELVKQALRSRRFGPYSLQAAIAAVHAEASTAEETDWSEIKGLYDVLLRVNPTPIIELNRAVALSMRDGPAAGLAAIDALFLRGELLTYHLAYAAKADCFRRLEQAEAAINCYEQALEFVQQEPERRFLQQRIKELKI